MSDALNKRRKQISASELISELQHDPVWAAASADREKAHLIRVCKVASEIEEEEKAILRKLFDVGVEVPTLSDFVNTKAHYDVAVPILVGALASCDHPVLREALARSLTIKAARGLASRQILRELMRPERDGHVRWALANALTVVATSADAVVLSQLSNDPEYGDVKERLHVALAVARSQH